MVYLLTALLGLVLFGAGTARADLDLTPSEEVISLDHMPVTHVVFHDGAREISYQPPRGWSCTGSHNAAALSIPEHPQARAFIQTAAQVRIPAFDDKAGKLFHDNPALLQLPKGAKDITITAVTVNPLIIDTHPTLEVQMTYSFFGQSCAKSLVLCNRNGAEVSFTLDCLAPDFKMLETKFRGSLYSIDNL
jgi:hypothetical protein